MDDYKIPNNVLRSIDKRCKSLMISLYIFLTFVMGFITQIYIVIKILK